MNQRRLYTIGFTKKSLRDFIGLLRGAGVTKVIDVRLHNTSQLAGYAKKDDLQFILEAFGIGYEHVPELAPTEELMERYKKVEKDWQAFERDFVGLLEARRAHELWRSPRLAGEAVCLLCSESTEKHCHRRLVAEHFQKTHPEIEIVHLR